LGDHPSPVFGDRSAVPDDLTILRTDHFAIAFPPPQAAWARRTAARLEGFHREFVQAFRRTGFELDAPTGRLEWICFADGGDFVRYGRSVDRVDVSWLDAYYSSRTQRVVLLREGRPAPVPGPARVHHVAGTFGPDQPSPWTRPGGNGEADLARLRHEAAHQLAYATGLQKRGVMYPFWLAEGLAASFERGALTAGSGSTNNADRLADLIRARRRGSLVPLSQLVSWAHLPADHRDQAATAYAQAWALWQFLLTRHRQAVQSYLADLARLPMGGRPPRVLRREFVRAFGPVSELEPAWQQHVDRLQAGARAAAVSRP
jgi:hypothetical protein